MNYTQDHVPSTTIVTLSGFISLTPLDTSWEILLLMFGLVVLGVAIALYSTTRTITGRSTTSHISDNMNHRLAINSSSRGTAKDFRDKKSSNSVYVPYLRQATFREKCVAYFCCKKLEVNPSLSTIPSLDIADDEFDLVVEKLMLFNVPLAMTALPEDVDDHREGSTATKTKDTEVIFPPQVTKKKSHSTLQSYYAMIPNQPPLTDDKSLKNKDTEVIFQPQVTKIKSHSTLQSYYAMIPNQPPLTDDKSLKNKDNEVIFQPQVTKNKSHSTLQSYYAMIPNQPPLTVDKSLKSTEVAEDVQLLRSTQHKQSASMPFEPNVISSQHSVPSYDDGLRKVQSEVCSYYTTTSLRPSHDSVVTEGHGIAPTREQNIENDVQPGQRYMCRRANVTLHLPESRDPASIKHETQSDSYYDMVPQTPASNQAPCEESIGLKLPNTVVQSYFASVGPHTTEKTINRGSGNIGKMRQMSRPLIRSTPYIVVGSESKACHYCGPRQTMSPKNSSIYFEMIPKAAGPDESSIGGAEESSRTKREMQPVTTYFMRTPEYVPNVLSETSKIPVEISKWALDKDKIEDSSPSKGSTADNNIASPYPDSKPTPKDRKELSVGKNKIKAISPSKGTADNEMASSYPDSKPNTDLLQRRAQGAIPRYKYTPEAAREQSEQATQSNIDIVAATQSQTKETDLEEDLTATESRSRTAFGATEKISVMHVRSTSSMRSSPEAEVVTMSAGRLVPTTDEERRQMHQYLNQFSSIFTYNLKDPIPKDPETMPQSKSSVNQVQPRETRTALAESISHEASTRHLSQSKSYQQPPREVSDHQTPHHESRTRSFFRRRRSQHESDSDSATEHENKTHLYTAHVSTDNQHRRKINFQESNTSVEVVTGSVDYSENDIFPEPKKTSRRTTEKESKGVLGSDTSTHSTAELNIARTENSGFTSKNECSDLSGNSKEQYNVPGQKSGTSQEIDNDYLKNDTGLPDTVPVRETSVSKEMSRAKFDANISKERKPIVPVQEHTVPKENSCSNVDSQINPGIVPVPEYESGLSKEMSYANLGPDVKLRMPTLPTQKNTMPKEKSRKNLDTKINSGPVPVRESGISKEMSCANLDTNISEHRAGAVPIRESGLSKEIGCANLDSNVSKQRAGAVPIRESGLSKEIGCANLDSNVSKQRAGSVPIRESGLSKEVGCYTLGDYQRVSNANQKSEKRIITPVPYGLSSELGCASISQLSRQSKLLIANNADRSTEITCKHLYETDSKDDVQSVRSKHVESGKEPFCSPSSSEQVENLHNYESGNTWKRKSTSVHSALVQGSNLMPLSSQISKSPIPTSGIMGKPQIEPCMHDSIISIMSPVELRPSSSSVIKVSESELSRGSVRSSKPTAEELAKAKAVTAAVATTIQRSVHFSPKSSPLDITPVLALTDKRRDVPSLEMNEQSRRRTEHLIGPSPSVINDTKQQVPFISPLEIKLAADRSIEAKRTMTVAAAETPHSIQFTPLSSGPGVGSNKDDSIERQQSNVSVKMPAQENVSKASAWEDGQDLSRSRTSQSPQGATLRWKIIIKHRKDDLESRTRVPTARIEEIRENEPISPPTMDDNIQEEEEEKRRD